MSIPVTLLYSEQDETPWRCRLRVNDQKVIAAAFFGLDTEDRKDVLDAIRGNCTAAEVCDRAKRVGASGVVASVIQHQGARRRTAEVFWSGEPGQGLLLGATGRPQSVEAKGSFNIAPGDHLLLPIDETSRHGLSQLVAALQSLPRDHEILLLDTLRRPSLEERVSWLENLRPAPASGKRLRRFWIGARSWFTAPAPAGLLLVLFLLLATPLLWVTHDVIGGSAQDPEGQPQNDTAKHPPDRQPPGPPPPSEPEEMAWQSLIAAMGSSSDADVKNLYATHLQGGPAWGVLKLKLRLGDTTSSQADFYENLSLFSETKELTKGAVEKWSIPTRAALAWAACRAWMAPEIPEKFGKVNDANVPVQLLGDGCAELPKDQVIAGLEQLTQEVQALSTPPVDTPSPVDK